MNAVSEHASAGARRLESLAEETFALLLRQQDVGDAPDFTATLRECLNRDELRKTLELDN